jgi:hypothetical protein
MSASITDLDLNVIDNMAADGFYVISLFGITLASISYMAKQFEIKMNWSSMKYKPDIAKYSWLLSNVENHMKDGILDAENKITQQIVMNPVVKSLDDATNKMNSALSKVSKDVAGLKQKIDETNKNKDTKNATLAITLQNNILALKEGMKKVIASLIIQRHVNNDTIKMMSGTRSLQESVRVAINKVSGQSPIAPMAKKSTTAPIVAPIAAPIAAPMPVQSSITVPIPSNQIQSSFQPNDLYIPSSAPTSAFVPSSFSSDITSEAVTEPIGITSTQGVSGSEPIGITSTPEFVQVAPAPAPAPVVAAPVVAAPAPRAKAPAPKKKKK